MARIRDTDIEEVRRRAHLIDVASEYMQVKKAGRLYKALCPFHTEKTPSLSLDPAKGLFHWTPSGVRPVKLQHTELGAVTAVYRDGRGQIWVGAERGALVRLVRSPGAGGGAADGGMGGPGAADQQAADA